MPCALMITSPGKLLTAQDSYEVFSLVWIIEGGNVYGQGNSRISFVDFLGVAHLYYYFTEFSLPFDDGAIDKKDVLRSVDQGVLPTTLTQKQINEMFDGFEELPYRGFAGLLWAQRWFSRTDAAEENGLIEHDEFMSIFDHPRFNQELIKLIDGLVMPTQEEIEDVALKRLGRPANEADYLINFI